MQRSGRVLVCLAALLSGATPAAATSATVLRQLNVRTGPGTNFPVISQLPAGATIEAMACSPSWCTIAWNGPAFVAASYLGFDGPPPYVDGPLLFSAPPPVMIAPPGPPVMVAPPPPVYYGPPPRFYGVPPGPGPGLYGGVGVWGF
ncbi:SH3 domain-containing protein [Aquabacter spiritensis]|uniref:SH3 domain-containing protein n=1 Tax=Aquabacter spiritensis TaxID=933073 RepID=A0A4R3LNA0_9HYPH|nr:SH3 domain-containing protein [Aquabacter spiritensis]TCT01601.1 SH3 domain-containing protein [Aquabacter spiritensis]